MPPLGLRSRKAAIGEPSPSGSSSSIFVFGNVTKTTVTPCSACGTGSETVAPRASAYSLAASVSLGTAMATWFSRPIIVRSRSSCCLTPLAQLRQQHLGNGTLPPEILDTGAHRPAHGFAHHFAVLASRRRNAAQRAIDDIEEMLKHAVAGIIQGRHTIQRDLRIGQQLTARGKGEGDDDHAGECQGAALTHGTFFAADQ